MGHAILLVFLRTDQLKDFLREEEPWVPERLVDDAVSTTQLRTAIFGTIVIGLWIWMAIMNREGRYWARIVATILGVLALVSFSLQILASATFLGSHTAIDIVLLVIYSALALTTMVLMYRPDATAYDRTITRSTWDRDLDPGYQRRPCV